MVLKKFSSVDESLDDSERNGPSSNASSEQQRSLLNANSGSTVHELAAEIDVGPLTIFSHLKTMWKSKKLNEWLPHELYKNKKSALWLLCFFCATITTHCLIHLWRVMRIGCFKTFHNVWLYGSTAFKLHNNFWSQDLTQRRLWSLFVGLELLSSITACWNQAEWLRRRAAAKKLTKCTRVSDLWVLDWSVWRDHFNSAQRPAGS